MTQIPDDDFDPEDGAEAAASAAYMQWISWQTVAVMAAIICDAVLFGASLFLVVLATQYVPPVAQGFLWSFLIAGAASEAVMLYRSQRERKARRAAADGDRTVAFLDSVHQQRAELRAQARLSVRMKTGKWWRAVAILAVSTVCAGVVFTAWWGPAIGIPAAVAFGAVNVAVARYGRTRARVFADGVVFLDPRPPRDSPEV